MSANYRRTLGSHDGALPYLFEAGADTGPLAAFCARREDEIRDRLNRHGAVLFRGFGIESEPAFEEVAGVVSHGLVAEGGEHQRLSDDSQVYVPVAYPADRFLMWHNEDSFNPEWPRKIMFCPVRIPAEGGETPLVDSRDLFQLLDPALRDEFVERGVIYHRTYGMGVGRSWREVFRTENPSEVEAYCREHDMELEWRSDEALVTRQKRQAVARHPETDEMVWFAQIQHWHPACLDPATRDSLEALFDEEDMPRNCFYGDGEPIEDDVVDAICDGYRQLQAEFPWRVGDVMVVDNMLAAHARNPYVGPRKLLVALGELTSDYNL